MNKNVLMIGEDIEFFHKMKNSVKSKLTFVEYALALSDGLGIALKKDCCLVILNMPMTEEKGFSLLHEIRKVYAVPILIVSTNKNMVDMVCAIRMGADDYLISPFEDCELIARIHSLIRRYTVFNNLEQDNSLQSNDILIDISKRFVSIKSKRIDLTPKEFDILCFFAENRGKVFSKEQIYTHVWGAEYAVDDGNITAHIRRVRKKIEPNPSNPIYIKTVWGVGYRFCES